MTMNPGDIVTVGFNEGQMVRMITDTDDEIDRLLGGGEGNLLSHSA